MRPVPEWDSTGVLCPRGPIVNFGVSGVGPERVKVGAGQNGVLPLSAHVPMGIVACVLRAVSTPREGSHSCMFLEAAFLPQSQEKFLCGNWGGRPADRGGPAVPVSCGT